MLVLSCSTSSGCAAVADVAAAMSVEALLGTDAAFDADVQRLRPHEGSGSAPPTSCG